MEDEVIKANFNNLIENHKLPHNEIKKYLKDFFKEFGINFTNMSYIKDEFHKYITSKNIIISYDDSNLYISIVMSLLSHLGNKKSIEELLGIEKETIELIRVKQLYNITFSIETKIKKQDNPYHLSFSKIVIKNIIKRNNVYNQEPKESIAAKLIDLEWYLNLLCFIIKAYSCTTKLISLKDFVNSDELDQLLDCYRKEIELNKYNEYTKNNENFKRNIIKDIQCAFEELSKKYNN